MVAQLSNLVRAITRIDLTAAVVNGVIGSSIFALPSRQAELLGPLSPVACVVAGLGVLTMVLCFAEVASRFDAPGGPYLYARESFGGFVGFQAGWLSFWIRVTALAAGLDVFATYLAELVPAASGATGRAVAIAALVVLVTAVNLLGVRQATWSVDLFTAAKLLPLLLLGLLGLPLVRPGVLHSQAVARPDWTTAVLLLVFAYGGFEAPLIPAGEARDPRRDSAFALVAALAVVATVYTLVNLVVVGLLPQAATVKAPIAAALQAVLGPAGRSLASLTAVASIAGYSLGVTLQSPRLLMAMAERGELPRALARVHPRFRTPHLAILTFAGLSLALALLRGFEWAAALSAVVRLVTYGLTCLALPVLRRRRPAEAPGFRLRGATLVVPLAVGFCAWLLLTRSFEQAWILLVMIAAGAALYAVARLQARLTSAATGGE